MGKVKLITFQSKEVLNELLFKGIYYADNSKSREKRDYSKDIEALGGYQPVWCFRVPEPLDLESLYWGNSYIFKWSNEMSLGKGKGLEDFEMIELDVDSSLPITGKTHNSYKHAVVLPYLKIEWLVTTYTISERFVLDMVGNPLAMKVFNRSEIYNAVTEPLFEDNFHYLTDIEYERVSNQLVPNLPLKAYPHEGEVKPELVFKYRNKEITKEEFHIIIGFSKNKISTNPLD